MHIAILTGLQEKEEFFSSRPLPDSVQVTVADSLRAFEAMEADAYFDLSFDSEYERRPLPSTFHKGLLFVNDVSGYAAGGKTPLVRINGWPTFLKRGIIELSLTHDSISVQVAEFFSTLGWKYQVVKDVPGFVTARVVSALINEAYFTVGAHVSTKAEIDIAMKLGTNYPYGPFEWSELIGLHKVASLLRKLSATDERYLPAPALEIDLLMAARTTNR
jgi:3-hydroxybutyryl-CoA dehydrogenase